MSQPALYHLQDQVRFEPTICRWPAWPQTVAPANAGLHIKNRYLKIMESYLEDPQLHYNASRDPMLIGGPFIHIAPEQKDVVSAAYEGIKRDAKVLIDLAECFAKLNGVLMKEAKGHAIERLYAEVPSMLKGMVELTYDLNNFPRLRLIEPLLYRRYYEPKHQSVIMGSIVKDYRPFALSTPRLPHQDEIEIKRPFHDRLYDRLFAARETPISLDGIAEIFQGEDIDRVTSSFFQPAAPKERASDRKYRGDGLRVRYFGHACVLIETKDLTIMVDPLVCYQYATEHRRYTLADLPEHIDYVLFTHAHEDHVVLETILQLRHKVGHFVIPRDHRGSLADPSIELILRHIGFDNLIRLEELGSISLGNQGEIIGLPFLGEHGDLEIGSKLGYCLAIKGKKILFLADSNNVEPAMYELIFHAIGPVDVVFVGMESEGGPLTFQYGGLITIPLDYNMDKSRRLGGCDLRKALDIAERSKCKQAYVYAMGSEPWLNHLLPIHYTDESLGMVNAKKFVEICRSRGVESELLYCQREWTY